LAIKPSGSPARWLLHFGQRLTTQAPALGRDRYWCNVAAQRPRHARRPTLKKSKDRLSIKIVF
ncbi:hypothetical protein, partial [Pseudomonas sp.]|uniref:hypothetical protein n=1 Tax=Pseudomonas sp. TaxID=306 RepID=UPI003BB49AC6